MISPKRTLASILFLSVAHLCHGADFATLSGKVTDTAARPLPGATVMIYYAGVKRGYSTFCPSCYADCGKRTTTDGGGAFVIKGLSPDLWFTLLVIHEGFAPTFVKRIDPSAGPPTATLPARSMPTDPAQLLRGRVVGPSGSAIADAVISAEEVEWNTPTGPTGAGGAVEGLDPITISNE